jgi:hypothetical protein
VATNVDPAVRAGTSAATSRTYSVAAQQIIQNNLDPNAVNQSMIDKAPYDAPPLYHPPDWSPIPQRRAPEAAQPGHGELPPREVPAAAVTGPRSGEPRRVPACMGPCRIRPPAQTDGGSCVADDGSQGEPAPTSSGEGT